MRVYIKRSQPRQVLLATSTYALSFESTDQGGAKAPVVVPKFFPRKEADFTNYDSPTECYGCVGLINGGDDVFVCVITDRSKAATPTPHRTVWNIHAVEFFGLHSDFFRGDEEHPLAALRKFFALGGFLYSSDFDLTAPIRQTSQDNVAAFESFARPVDPSFMWNQFMIGSLNNCRERLSNEDQKAVYEGGYITTLIRGFASTIPIRLDHIDGTLTVLSKQSWLRSGTRYNSRGIDDEGNVANFVESETVLWLRNGQQFGFVQLRGSVPLFWEQDPQLLTAKIMLTRPVEATEPAMRKHFDNLVDRFGAVHIVDLLGGGPGGSRGNLEDIVSSASSIRSNRSNYSSQSGRSTSSSSGVVGNGVGPATEADISTRYQNIVQKIHGLRYTHFDFHKEVAGFGYSAASKLIDRIQESMLEFGFYSYNKQTGSAETEQIGAFRVNCLDCLDRTNLVQQLISKDALDLFLDFNELYGNEDLWNAHATLWADNGDQLSQNYTGTGALKSSYTRSGRMNLAGALSDVSKSVSRLYINNFVDKERQSAIEELLGKSEGQLPVKMFDPINDHVWEEMKQRTQEYSTESQISVFAATFNVNAKIFDRSEDISAWLFPPEVSNQLPDLYIVGFQELVELTTSQILNVDPTRKLYWEELVGDCLNSRGEHYVLLRSGQLVGIAIMLFVKRPHMHAVTDVEGTSKKTALGGITGNKGGVAVGFKYANTRFTFVNSHLAAGMHNLEDRHNDYKLLTNGLRMSGGRRIKDADVVIWLGDFNYRIDLPNDTVRKLLKHRSKEEAIRKMLEHDQLTKQMELGETFPYFNEAEIKFMPTYKFDVGTSNYDTSDKQRVPAWTDRILMRGHGVKQRAYSSVSQIKFSDHRPVYALYDISVSIVDSARADKLYSQLYDKRRVYLLSNGNGNGNSAGGSNGSVPLQHPSSDTQKWWAGGGLSTKVGIQVPKGQVLNPERRNPFNAKEPDFVNKPQPPPPRVASIPNTPSSPLVPSRSAASANSAQAVYDFSPNSAARVQRTSNNPSSSSIARKPLPSLGRPSDDAIDSISSLIDAPIAPVKVPAPSPRKTSNTGSRASSIKSEARGSLLDSDNSSNVSFQSLI